MEEDKKSLVVLYTMMAFAVICIGVLLYFFFTMPAYTFDENGEIEHIDTLSHETINRQNEVYEMEYMESDEYKVRIYYKDSDNEKYNRELWFARVNKQYTFHNDTKDDAYRNHRYDYILYEHLMQKGFHKMFRLDTSGESMKVILFLIVIALLWLITFFISNIDSTKKDIKDFNQKQMKEESEKESDSEHNYIV